MAAAIGSLCWASETGKGYNLNAVSKVAHSYSQAQKASCPSDTCPQNNKVDQYEHKLKHKNKKIKKTLDCKPLKKGLKKNNHSILSCIHILHSIPTFLPLGLYNKIFFNKRVFLFFIVTERKHYRQPVVTLNIIHTQ